MQIIVLIILIALNAYFACSEIAFISLNDAKVEKDAKEGNKKAKQIHKMIKEPSKFLATIQIGITLAGFLSSAFAADTYASELAPILNNLIPLGIGVWNTISIIIITMILSYFTLVFGELVPKRIAMKNYEKIAYGTVGVIKAISVITSPFVKLLTASTNVISKLFGVSAQDEEMGKRVSESFCGRNFISYYYAGNQSGFGYSCKIGMDGNGICCVVAGIIFAAAKRRIN